MSLKKLPLVLYEKKNLFKKAINKILTKRHTTHAPISHMCIHTQKEREERCSNIEALASYLGGEKKEREMINHNNKSKPKMCLAHSPFIL